MLIDFHTHIFPDALAARAVPQLAKKGGVTPRGQATLASTRAMMKRDGVDISVMLSIATNARQMQKVNDFARSVASADIVPFGSVYPQEREAAVEELERIAHLGMKGIKLHPEYQEFSVTEERFLPVYEKAVSLGLVIVFHAGQDVGYPDTLMAPPEALAALAAAFPQGKLVFAHMGGYNLYERVLKRLAGCGAYLDTAVVHETLDPALAAEIIAAHGADRILFGTDCPWGTAADTLRYLANLGLTEEETELIKHGNAERLLGLAPG